MVLKSVRQLAVLCSLITIGYAQHQSYWREDGLKSLAEEIARKQNRPVAKNLIFFLGDGMGVSTVTAARFLKSEIDKAPYYSTKFSIDKFPHVALSLTYTTDREVADSAGTATAYHTGVKTKNGYIGLDERGDQYCNNTASRLESIAHWAADEGKSIGIVTTTPVTHASPSPLYSQSHDRYWNSDSGIPEELREQCRGRDIASQLLSNRLNPQIVLGGGLSDFHDGRADGRNLMKEWQEKHAAAGAKARLVLTKSDLLSAQLEDHEFVLGLFANGSMEFMDESPPPEEPNLSEMTEFALNKLKKDDDGFYLFVEGGRIDHGHHDGIARRALYEMIEFEKAIQTAIDMTSEEDTLIVVTADHSHTFTIAGYTPHDTPIFGTVSNEMAADGKPYTTLIYATGPGALLTYQDDGTRVSPVGTEERGYHQQAAVHTEDETHGGEEVAIYARGPRSELFSGTKEQNYIAFALSCAAGIGPGKNVEGCGVATGTDGNSAAVLIPVLMTNLIMRLL